MEHGSQGRFKNKFSKIAFKRQVQCSFRMDLKCVRNVVRPIQDTWKQNIEFENLDCGQVYSIGFA